MSVSQLVSCLPSIPGCPDPLQLDVIRTSQSTRQVHIRLSRLRLPQNKETGSLIGILAQKFRLPADILQVFVKAVISEWRFTGKDWEHNTDFIQGILQGYEKHDVRSEPRPYSFEEFMRSLEEAARSPTSVTAPQSMTTNDTQQLKGSGESPVPLCDVYKVPIDINSQFGIDTDRSQRQTVQQSLFSTRATYGQDIKAEVAVQEWQSPGTCHLGKWKEVQGFGTWMVRVYDSVPKAEDALLVRNSVRSCDCGH